MLFLVVLAVVPIVTASRAQVHRRLIADTIEPARIASGELEAYTLEQLLASFSAASPGGLPPVAKTRRTADPRAVAQQWATLDSAAATLGGIPAARVAVLKREMGRAISGLHNESLPRAAASRTIDASESLQQALDARIAEERLAAVDVERWNVWLPMIIVPLALAGVFALGMAGRDVITLGRAAQESAAALADATEAKAALLRGVTHDLKNPLGAAQGFTELLSAGLLGELTDRSRAAVARVDRLLGEAINIVKDLTELARVESGELGLVSSPTQLGRLLAECISDYEPAARSNGVTLTPRPDDLLRLEPPPILTDPRRIRQILDNLLTNAIKYTPEHGAVSVSLTIEPQTSLASITVSDTGPGIPEELRSKVFDEFFRLRGHDLDTQSGAPTGTGVGLAISRRLARLLGGDLTVAAANGGGAAFTLTIPAPPSRERKG